MRMIENAHEKKWGPFVFRPKLGRKLGTGVA